MMSSDFGSLVGPGYAGGGQVSIEALIQRLWNDPKTRHIAEMLMRQMQGGKRQPLARGGLAGFPDFGGLNSVRELNLGYGIK